MSSPPFTPIRHYMASTETSPSQRQSLGHRRRSSSFSNNRSPTTARSTYSDHRLSNASRYSNGIHDLGTPLDSHGAGVGGGVLGGGGNLADELEFADEDEDEEGDWDEQGLDEGVSGVAALSLADDMDRSRDTPGKQSMQHDFDAHEHDVPLAAQTDGARDSGVDVAYQPSPTPMSINTSTAAPLSHAAPSRPQSKQQPHRNFSRPMSRDSEVSSPTDTFFSREMEDAMAAISRLASPPSQQQSDGVLKAVAALQHLSPQSTLETQTQRLTTSTNSLTSHLVQQTRIIASLSSALFPPIGLAAPLDLAVIEDVLPQMDLVLQNLPLPDALAFQGLTKLDRDTTDLLHTLAGLTDSLQMGKQGTTSAARHLRNTLTMVSQLRRESELAEQAKWKIEKESWDRRLAERWCARECSDVVGGFEQVCEGLRQGLEESAAA